MTDLKDLIWWADKFRDHAFFLYLLLDERKAAQLKNSAKISYDQWRQLLNGAAFSVDTFSTMLNNLSDLKTKILLSANDGINTVLPKEDFIQLLQHMLKELNFFVQLNNNKITSVQELAFWIVENAEHTNLTAHTLQPSKLRDDFTRLAQLLQTTPIEQILPIIHSSNTIAEQLDDMINSGKVHSIMSPMMLEHEIKEAKMGEQRIKELLK